MLIKFWFLFLLFKTTLQIDENEFLKLWSTIAERFSASDCRSDGWVVLMWVWILAATVVLVSLSKTLYCDCFSSPREYKWVPARVEVDIVFEKAFWALRQLRAVYTPQGAEKDYRDDYWPSDQGADVKRIDTLLWNALL